jgi:hypothetical protein
LHRNPLTAFDYDRRAAPQPADGNARAGPCVAPLCEVFEVLADGLGGGFCERHAAAADKVYFGALAAPAGVEVDARMLVEKPRLLTFRRKGPAQKRR